MKSRLQYFLIIVLISTSSIEAQVIYATSDKQVYNFLSRLHQKGLIDYNPNNYPLSKSDFSDHLISIIPKTMEQYLGSKEKGIKNNLEITNNYSNLSSQLLNLLTSSPSLTQLDIEQTLWYFEKHSLESGHNKSIFGQYNYSENNFSLRLYPIAGYGISTTGNKNGHTRKIGAHVDAYLGDNLGIMFEFLNTSEYGGILIVKRMQIVKL